MFKPTLRTLDPLRESARQAATVPHGHFRLMMCTGTGCVAGGAFGLKAQLEQEIERQGLRDRVSIVATGCNGFCGQGPLFVVEPDHTFYGWLKPDDIPRLVHEHLLKGRPVESSMFVSPVTQKPVASVAEIPFFEKQHLIVLRNRGVIDPERIEDYLARDGYAALEKALGSMMPAQVIEEIANAGLRGRGGA